MEAAFEDGNVSDWTPDGCTSSWGPLYFGGDHGKVYYADLVPAGGCHASLNNLVPTTNDYRIEADVKIVRETSGGDHGVMGRASDFNSYYLFYIHADYSDAGANVPQMMGLLKRVDGQWISIMQQTTTNILSNTWYRMAIEFEGSVIRCFIDGARVYETTDSSINGNKFGLMAMGSGVYFDNVPVIGTMP